MNQIVHPEPEDGHEQDWATAETVRQCAQDGGAQELHEGIDCDDDTVVIAGARDITVKEYLDQLREDWNDDSDS